MPDQTTSPDGPLRRALPWILLLLIVALGLLLRLEDLRDWKQEPQRVFHQGEPLIRTMDGYYYLYLARELLAGTWKEGFIEPWRCLQAESQAPAFPPLLSLITAAVSHGTGIPLIRAAVYLPPLLGVLLVLPVFFLGRHLGGTICGLLAALFAGTSSYYLYRSSLGFFDTDILNVTFTVTITLFFILFALNRSRRRYLHLALALVTSLLFFLWWRPYAVTALVLTIFVAAMVLFFRNAMVKEKMVAAVLLLLLILVPLAGLFFGGQGLAPIGRLFQTGLARIVNYAVSAEAWHDQDVVLSISELQRPSFAFVVESVAGGPLLFAAGLGGILLLLIRKPRQALLLAAPLALGFISLLAGRRFLIFLSPFFALGAGFLAAELCRLLRGRRRWWYGALLLAGFTALSLPSIRLGMSKTYWPSIHPAVAGGLEHLASLPDDTVVWNWWDNGLPLAYWSRQCTLADNMQLGNVFYQAWPLATDSPAVAAGFMHFYIKRGDRGMDLLLEQFGDWDQVFQFIDEMYQRGPEASLLHLRNLRLTPLIGWYKYMFPRQSLPLYLYLDGEMTKTAYWWYWYGTWNYAKREGIHPTVRGFAGLRSSADAISAPGLAIDRESGILVADDMQTTLSRVVDISKKMMVARDYPGGSDLQFEFYHPARFGLLHSTGFGDSLFNQLFIRQMYDPASFRPVVLASPVLQVWEVVRDDQTIARTITRLHAGLIPIGGDPVEWLDPGSAVGESVAGEPEPPPPPVAGRGPEM